jgi:hypothetical protein
MRDADAKVIDLIFERWRSPILHHARPRRGIRAHLSHTPCFGHKASEYRLTTRAHLSGPAPR